MKLTVTNQSIEFSEKSLIVEKSNGLYECEFTFSDDWDGYSKTAIFQNGSLSYSVTISEGKATIPYEVLVEGLLQIGVCGINGTIQKPTVWSEPVRVLDGAYTGLTPSPVTPTQYEQIMAIIGDMEDLDTTAKDTLVNAINEIVGSMCTDTELATAVSELHTWVEAKGYATETSVDTKDATTLASAKTYADTKKTEAISTSESYTDDKLTDYRTASAQDVIDATKVDKVEGKGLSTNDYTTAEKTKLSGIEEGAEVNDITDVQVNGTSVVSNKTAFIPIASTQTDGAMSSSDKTKLEGIESGAEVNPSEYLVNASVSNNKLTITDESGNVVEFEGGGAVSSVNGKTGAVTLYGTDINMSSDTSLPTVTEQISSNKTNIAAQATQIGEIEDELEDKADIDGYYETMSVGLADNLIDRKSTGTEQEFTFRTSCGDESINDDGQGIVQSIHGNTLVWNQLVRELTSDYWNASNSSATFADNVVTFTATQRYGGASIKSTYKPYITSGHKYFVGFKVKPTTSNSTIRINFSLSGGGIVPASSTNTANVWNDVYSILTAGAAGYAPPSLQDTRLEGWDEVQVKDIMLIDLTQMFGSGNEPTTVAQFKSLYPLDYYAYNSGTLLSYNGTGLKTVGFNQLDSDGHIKVIANQTYHIEGTYTSLIDSDGNSVTVTNSEFTPTKNDTYTMAGGTCVHLKWSGYRNGETEDYWTNTLSLPISTYFANGMRSAGSVYDELTKNKAITRIGTRTYQSGDLDDTSVITDGTNTFYALTTPTEVTISPPLELNYPVADFGTEESLPENTSTPTTSPIDAIISYSTDATRTIANLPKHYDSTDSLDALCSALATALGTALNGTFTITRGAYDETNKKYAFTCSFTANS